MFSNDFFLKLIFKTFTQFYILLQKSERELRQAVGNLRKLERELRQESGSSESLNENSGKKAEAPKA